MRSPRWPVASVTATPPTRTTPATPSAIFGEMPPPREGDGLPAPRPGDDRPRAGAAATLARGLASARRAPRTAAGICILRDPRHQLIEPNTGMGRLLGNERSRRHAGLRVHLQKDQKVVNVVITKVRS